MADVPLAARMRPRTFEEFVGQSHLIGPGKALTQRGQSTRDEDEVRRGVAALERACTGGLGLGCGLAADHLVSIGRRRIAYITGDITYLAARDRVEGAVAALGDH